MPVYAYTCPSCSYAFDHVVSVSHRNYDQACPACGNIECKRDFVESMKPHTDKGFSSPALSRAMGVMPEQIAEAQANFPHHKFAPDGRMVFESAKEYDQARKDLGME